LDHAPDAWEKFADRFLGLVIHVVQHSATARNVHLSTELKEDLVADVFLAWIKNDYALLRRFRGLSSLATYLTVVSRRIAIRRISQLRLPHAHHSDLPNSKEPASRETSAYTEESIELLESSLSKLSDNEAAAVRMFHLEGKSYSDIGSHLGMPENSIGPFLSRARNKMKRTV
jgi:RNA polymerase sigma-70 factor (ECF subfamily)